MDIIKWEPFAEVDRFFEDRLYPNANKIMRDLAVDLYEENGNVVAKMTLPEVDPNDLEIFVENSTLRISGRREEEKETKEKDYYSKEIRRGSFHRSVSLPRTVDADKTYAEYTDGMLTVTMPVINGQKKHAIKIKVKK